MRWLLDKCLLDEVGDGWSVGSCKLQDIPDPQRFRLLDDDGEVYFTGHLSAGDLNSCSADCAFEPLDDFGSAYGCTELQYYEKGWRAL